MTGNALIYGSYGYTGRKVVEEAVNQGMDVTIGGRNKEKIKTQSKETGLDSEIFKVEEAEKYLEGYDTVLNCAGPFTHTYRSMVSGCLSNGVTYLDITGEVDVFRSIADMDEEAKKKETSLIPGVGFDVVPTDCLAYKAAEEHGDPDSLYIALQALSSPSPGTAETLVEHIGSGGLIRINGELTRVPVAHKSRKVDFGNRTMNAVTIPWGDVVTAFYTTGAPNIEVYAGMSKAEETLLRGANYTSWLIGSKPIKPLLRSLARISASGPTEEQYSKERTHLWVRAESPDKAVEMRMETPNPYRVTVDACIEVLRRLGEQDTPPGYQTPVTAFGDDLAGDASDIEVTQVDPVT